MKRSIIIGIIMTISALAFGEVLNTKQFQELPFETIYTIPELKIENRNESREFTLPALPVKPGKKRALRGRFTSWFEKIGGCNTAMRIEVNAVSLGRYTEFGEERILCKDPVFVFNTTGYAGVEFDYFEGNGFCLPFAPSVDYLDEHTVGNNGSMLLLDLEDVVLGVDGNALKFTNVRDPYGLDVPTTLIGADIEIGYLDEAALPQPPGLDFKYTSVANAVERNGIRLEVGKAGGFSICNAKGDVYVIDTKLTMSFKAPYELLAEDIQPQGAPQVTLQKSGDFGFAIMAKWENGIQLYRRLSLEHDGMLHWLDDWKNTSNEILGVPYHHRIRTAGFGKKDILCGAGDKSFIPSTDMNPSVVVLNNSSKDGSGIGIVEDNDFARLLGSLKATAAETEIYTAHFALAPQCSLPMNYSVDIFQEGGYWAFLNRLRKRWNIGTVTAPYPLFLVARYTKSPGDTQAEKIKNAFAHLGPIAVGVVPWRRSDFYLAGSGQYPKLPEGAEPAPGISADLDLTEFLKFKNRDAQDEAMAAEIKLFRENAPNVKYIPLTHPAMETVYLPMAEQWPYADNEIHTVEGTVYHHPHYDRAHVGSAVEKGWAIGYYAPYGGSRYYDMLIDDVKRAFEYGADGIYIDEFSFGAHRDYSRYDYGRWDGFSADLDENGKVTHLKTDVAYISQGLQNAVVSLAAQQNKYFLGNGSAALRSVNTIPALRFWEGGNGMATLGFAHLNQVPLVLGNYGITDTQQGLFNAVKEALQVACIYSPGDGYLALKGPDNFICKMYPITVDELYPGTVIGKERIITINSGTFAWSKATADAKFQLFVYDSEGNRITPSEEPVVKDGQITITVPKNGMSIVELTMDN